MESIPIGLIEIAEGGDRGISCYLTSDRFNSYSTILGGLTFDQSVTLEHNGWVAGPPSDDGVTSYTILSKLHLRPSDDLSGITYQLEDRMPRDGLLPRHVYAQNARWNFLPSHKWPEQTFGLTPSTSTMEFGRRGEWGEHSAIRVKFQGHPRRVEVQPLLEAQAADYQPDRTATWPGRPQYSSFEQRDVVLASQVFQANFHHSTATREMRGEGYYASADSGPMKDAYPGKGMFMVEASRWDHPSNRQVRLSLATLADEDGLLRLWEGDWHHMGMPSLDDQWPWARSLAEISIFAKRLADGTYEKWLKNGFPIPLREGMEKYLALSLNRARQERYNNQWRSYNRKDDWSKEFEHQMVRYGLDRFERRWGIREYPMYDDQQKEVVEEGRRIVAAIKEVIDVAPYRKPVSA